MNLGGHIGPSLRTIAVLAFFYVVSVAFTWPLVPLSATHVAGEVGDPILNTSVLWWTSKTLPLSERWWSPPYFFPSQHITGFTENLLGISPVATPIYWLSGSPLVAYNLALFLAWPLSGFTVYLLVRYLTQRELAAMLAGLVFAFAPYRTHEMGHIQMVASYWIPLYLLGLHGYLRTRRARWLVLFGCAWFLQSIANMYMFLFGGVLVGLWLFYFCSTRHAWRLGPPIVFTWMCASLPLAPILLKYRAIHEEYGLSRFLFDPLGFSLPPGAWFQVSHFVQLWGRVLPDKENLFPGVVAPFIVLLGLTVQLRRGTPGVSNSLPHVWRRAAALLLFAVSALAIVTIAVGPWRLTVGGLILRVSTLDRAFQIAVVMAALLVASSKRITGAIARRDPWLFYTAMIAVMALCAYGPVVRMGRAVVLEHGPYWWLMKLPGFDELRVPFRIWMLGVLCMSIAVGYAFASLRFQSARARYASFCVLCGALGLDTWARMPMVPAPTLWPVVEPPGRSETILELPLGPGHDVAATFRSIAHGRPVVNGASGYDPPHYAPLTEGLNDHEPAVLLALSSFGPIDVVVDNEFDSSGGLDDYVLSVPGSTRIAGDGSRTLYRLPRSSAFDAAVGEALPIRAIRASHGDASAAIDGRLETIWEDLPQRVGQWIVADLGGVRDVGGVTHAMGLRARDFPRHLAIDLSTDGQQWHEVFQASMAAWAFRASAIEPTRAAMQITFQPQRARFIRLRQIASHQNFWLLAELTIHAP